MVSVGFPPAAATVTAVFIVTQATGVFLVLSGRAPEQGCMTLLVWTATHPFLYLQQKNLEFLLESVTIIGGLLILLELKPARRRRSSCRRGRASARRSSAATRWPSSEEAQEHGPAAEAGASVSLSSCTTSSRCSTSGSAC